MRAKAILSILVAAVLCSPWALGGCGRGRKKASNSEYVLGLLHESWVNARAGLQKDPPDLGPLRGIHVMLGTRAPRRVEKDYAGPNKQQLLERLITLRDAYEAQIVPKLNLQGMEVVLQPPATADEVRIAFAELDKQYRQIEDLLNQP
ncbi:MAG TPA: hypothetical protein VFJ30_08365 [Phycisphaerae bacterium]|nr:hypothetical protein [Phycisphaerae bacterium]